MFGDHDIHSDDEAGVEVDEDVPIDVKDGWMILDEDDSETVTKHKGEHHEEQRQNIRCRKHNKPDVFSETLIKAIIEKYLVFKCLYTNNGRNYLFGSWNLNEAISAE